MKPWILALGLLAILIGNQPNAETIETSIAQTMDPNADPCQDFYRYACGGWLDNHQLADDELQLIKGFDLANQAVEDKLYALFQTAAKLYPSGDSLNDQLGPFFQSCLDDDLQSSAITGLQPYLDAIDGIKNQTEFMQVAGQLREIGVLGLLNATVIPDFFDARRYSLLVTAGDPGFYDGDIYTRKSPANNKLKTANANDIQNVLLLLGEPVEQAARHTRQIMAIETVLSKHHGLFGTIKDLDYYGAPQILDQSAPYFPWSAYFGSAQMQGITSLYSSPSFLKALAKALRKTPLDGLKAYLRWTLISSYRPYLPESYSVSPYFRELISVPRWKTCLRITSTILSDKTGQLLKATEDYQTTANLTQSIFNNIKSQFRSRLPTVVWLNEDALAATQLKLDALTAQFAYPTEWPEYAPLSFDSNDFLGNVISARADLVQREFALYGQTVDRTSWEYNGPGPQQVNAFYQPLKNQIHLLAGLLRKPFVDAEYPDAVNYAAVGFVAAHEVMHGYDDEGRYFLEDGRAGYLWPKKVNKNFNKRSQCLVGQYNAYRVPDLTLKVKGKPTLEENLSDVNGLKLAYQAFAASGDSASQYAIGNLTLSAQQLFFVSFAQSFCSISRPEMDEYTYSRSWQRYAPPRQRVIGPISNRPEFAAAFNCPKNSAMNPNRKCQVW